MSFNDPILFSLSHYTNGTRYATSTAATTIKFTVILYDGNAACRRGLFTQTFLANTVQLAAQQPASEEQRIVKDSGVMTPDQAIVAAAADIGLTTYNQEDVSVRQITLRNESVPFLRKELTGKPAFLVEFRNVNLATLAGDERLSNSFITHLVALVPLESRHVLKVTSIWPDNVPRMADYPGCAEEERQLGEQERYTSLQTAPPAVPLLQAMSDNSHWSRQVKQIVAYRVMHSCRQHRDRDVWIIQFRGVVATHTKARIDLHGKMADDAFNHFRSLTDASSGEWLWSDLIPQPPGPVHERY